jgi:glutamyl-tRNA synthetase
VSERTQRPLCGRFAPSPTGPLHLGSLRTALVAWLLARGGGGRFRLRVEDIDPDRSRPQWEAVQLAALAGLGIDSDGPLVRQSERLALYAEALSRLESAGLVYPCFCTRADIRAAGSAPHGAVAGQLPAGSGGLPAGSYPGTCRRLSAAERAERVGRGERCALRFDASGAPVDFVDRLAGRQSWRVDDFVLRRSDGVFAYQLAVVVDDFAQDVTQVVRGADLLDSVGRQVMLMRALGYPEPSWAHVPLVLGPDGRRLAKRHGSDGAAQGPAETLARLAASLGITVDASAPPTSAADLLPGFDPGRIPAHPVTL